MKLSELFYSVQGEGTHVGRAAIFLRFYGCNLSCEFCDEPLHTSQYSEYSVEKVLERIEAYPAKFVVLTGGEPTLMDQRPLIDCLHKKGYYVAVETNGYRPAHVATADWITYSPKSEIESFHDPFWSELKILVDIHTDIKMALQALEKTDRPVYLQPKAEGALISIENTMRCVELIKQYPAFRLSLQTHKMIHIP